MDKSLGPLQENQNLSKEEFLNLLYPDGPQKYDKDGYSHCEQLFSKFPYTFSIYGGLPKFFIDLETNKGVIVYDEKDIHLRVRNFVEVTLSIISHLELSDEASVNFVNLFIKSYLRGEDKGAKKSSLSQIYYRYSKVWLTHKSSDSPWYPYLQWGYNQDTSVIDLELLKSIYEFELEIFHSVTNIVPLTHILDGTFSAYNDFFVSVINSMNSPEGSRDNILPNLQLFFSKTNKVAREDLINYIKYYYSQLKEFSKESAAFIFHFLSLNYSKLNAFEITEVKEIIDQLGYLANKFPEPSYSKLQDTIKNLKDLSDIKNIVKIVDKTLEIKGEIDTNLIYIIDGFYKTIKMTEEQRHSFILDCLESHGNVDWFDILRLELSNKVEMIDGTSPQEIYREYFLKPFDKLRDNSIAIELLTDDKYSLGRSKQANSVFSLFENLFSLPETVDVVIKTIDALPENDRRNKDLIIAVFKFLFITSSSWNIALDSNSEDKNEVEDIEPKDKLMNLELVFKFIPQIIDLSNRIISFGFEISSFINSKSLENSIEDFLFHLETVVMVLESFPESALSVYRKRLKKNPDNLTHQLEFLVSIQDTVSRKSLRDMMISIYKESGSFFCSNSNVCNKGDIRRLNYRSVSIRWC